MNKMQILILILVSQTVSTLVWILSQIKYIVEQCLQHTLLDETENKVIKLTKLTSKEAVIQALQRCKSH